MGDDVNATVHDSRSLPAFGPWRMNRIRLLPETVANQIAAGEVIERPASVVKELVENALDADARKIVVEIQAGGRSLIRVSDDGIGMSRDDALLSLERHATSKIRSAEDLFAIRTLGFRGEALPSIASVSRFTLVTREREGDQPEGTRILVHGGKILEVQAAGTPPGTVVEVRQLFFNVPARRKFLRSEETESAHAQHVVLLAALAHPEVAFTFIKDGRTLWQLPAIPCGSDPAGRLAALKERWRALYGTDESFLAVDFVWPADAGTEAAADDAEPDSDPSIRVWGLIGAPGVSRATRADQHLFVNRRPVESRALNHALLEGYHTALMKGRYPVCCLFLELDPAAVDVNIHPAKREVKFHREWAVRRAVTTAVRETLLAFHTRPVPRGPSAGTTTSAPAPAAQPQLEGSLPGLSVHRVEGSPPPKPPAVGPVSGSGPATGTPVATGTTRGSALAPSAPRPTAETQQQRQPMAPGMNRQGAEAMSGHPTAPAAGAPAAAPESSVAAPAPSPVAEPGSREPATTPAAGPVPLVDVPLRYLGVVGRLYVVFESDRGLVLMDQHAAHERVLFEEMLDRLERDGRAPSQKLLLPEAIELPPRDAAFLREQLEVLGRLGVGVSEFGTRSFLLDALPPFVRVTDPRRFLLDLVDELQAAGRELNTLRLGEPVVAKTVCRHAVKARDPLSEPELLNLLESLRRCRMPYTCPHGRPTLIELSYRELERKFGRAT